ncbi:MAG: carboxypeptidase M32 [Planctomycetes bacterium]|nr:carboxypeptidase M32 [Planctomycetota bacterium]
MPKSREAYEELLNRWRDLTLWGSIAGVVSWDQEVNLVRAGSLYRSEQLAALSGAVHQKAVNPRIAELLDIVEDDKHYTSDPHTDTAINIKEMRRDYDRATKLPQKLVEDFTRARSTALTAWIEAKQKQDFKIFAPKLERLVELLRETARCYGEGEATYDELLQQYEPDGREKEVDALLHAIEKDVGPLFHAIVEAQKSGKAKTAPTAKWQAEKIHRKCPLYKQREFTKFVSGTLGFNFEHGMIAESAHPFCTELGPFDIRMTTRYDEDRFFDGFSSAIHETGHAIYGQGLPAEHFGVPLGSPVSMAIHESQSRLWENMVLRCAEFWEFFAPAAKEYFPALADLEAHDFHKAVLAVQPSFIRIDADEVSYNLHIALRYDVEKKLFYGELGVWDVPEYWNKRFEELVGLKVTNDAEGCLQDTHWAAGLIGYFPTYTMGNCYAAQFFDQAKKDLPGLKDEFRKGNFTPLREWLREKIHSHGKRYTAHELVQRVTGKPLSDKAMLSHLRETYGSLYGVS